MSPTSRPSTSRSTDLSPAAGVRTGLTVADLKQSFLDNLFCGLGRVPDGRHRPRRLHGAGPYRPRPRPASRASAPWKPMRSRTRGSWPTSRPSSCPARTSANNLLNLGIVESTRAGAGGAGPGPRRTDRAGGGAGPGQRRAWVAWPPAYLDSLASLEVPAIGYGIRYEFGIFDQAIQDGWQVEITDKWLRLGNPWEIARPEIAFEVGFGGRTEAWTDAAGPLPRALDPRHASSGAWPTTRRSSATGSAPATLCASGRPRPSSRSTSRRSTTATTTGPSRTRSARRTSPRCSTRTTTCSRARPCASSSSTSSSPAPCRTCSASICGSARPLDTFHEKWAVQLNDTHPAIAVAELMRLLVDEHELDWDAAWDVTRKTFAYTNHTLLPEALENWPVACSASSCRGTWRSSTRSTARFLEEVRAKFPGDDARLARMSLIDESGERFVRMAHLAIVGSHHVNGVARLHSDLLKQTVLRDFAELWPEKFSNVTNGVTPRRFVAVSNPPLAELITGRIGDGWLTRPRPAPQARAAGGRRRFQQAVARGEARQQAEPRRAHRRPAHRREGGSRLAVRRAGQAHPRVQAPAPERAAHPHALPAPQSATRRRIVPARTFIFGGKAAPGLPHGQADHQADPRRGRRGEPRPGGARPAEGRVPPGLQRQERAAHLSRRPTCPSRSPPRARRPRARAT